MPGCANTVYLRIYNAQISAYMRNMRIYRLMRIGEKWRMANPSRDVAYTHWVRFGWHGLSVNLKKLLPWTSSGSSVLLMRCIWFWRISEVLLWKRNTNTQIGNYPITQRGVNHSWHFRSWVIWRMTQVMSKWSATLCLSDDKSPFNCSLLTTVRRTRRPSKKKSF